MNVSPSALPTMTLCGAEEAWTLANPMEEFGSFDRWLGQAIRHRRKDGRSEVVAHLIECCELALANETATPLHSLPTDTQNAIVVAHLSLQAFAWLEDVAVVAAVQQDFSHATQTSVIAKKLPSVLQ